MDDLEMLVWALGWQGAGMLTGLLLSRSRKFHTCVSVAADRAAFEAGNTFVGCDCEERGTAIPNSPETVQ